MSSTVARLWLGDLPSLIDLGANDPKVKQFEDLVQKHLENFRDTLDEEQKNLFMEYDNSWGEYLLAVGERAFCDGFSLGVKLTAESFTTSAEE